MAPFNNAAQQVLKVLFQGYLAQWQEAGGVYTCSTIGMYIDVSDLRWEEPLLMDDV